MNNNSNKNSVILGATFSLIGLAWFLVTFFSFTPSLDLSRWWAFGMVIPILVGVYMMAYTGGFRPNFAGAIIAVVSTGLMLVFLGLFPFAALPAVSIFGAGAAFLVTGVFRSA